MSASMSEADRVRTAGTARTARARNWDQEHLANLYSLFVLSMIMNDGRDEADIMRLALTSVAALGPCRAEAGHLTADGSGADVPSAGRRALPGLGDRLRQLDGREGPVLVPGRAWGWAFALHTRGGGIGHLVVSAPTTPTDDERFLIHVLAQQTSAALANAAARRREREHAEELRRLNEERESVNAQLAASVAELTYQRTVHEVLSEATASGSGVAGIAAAVHRLTGCPVAIEDRFGNLRAWAGPGRPDPYPKPDAARRELLLQEAARRLRPLRVGDRLIAVVQHRGEVLGAMALVAAEDRRDEQDEFTLDHACTALSLELAHLHSLAEVELRLRRELVDDLVAGTDDESAYARAAAIGHDLHGPHYPAVVQWEGRAADDAFVQAVGRAAAGLRLRCLPARRSGMAVLVLRGRPPADALHQAVSRELGTARGAIGVGGRCDAPRDLPRSFQQALRALEVRCRSQSPNGATTFDDLGFYRILGTGDGDYQEVGHFVREWLGPLLDYDAAHHCDLARTLAQYFECGGNYDATAAALDIHRSTLRYRLQRIRDVGGNDLTDVDSRLNLHVATRLWKVLDGGGP
ncbi:PucR family transcriptional regulator [Streptomyces sp. NPDC088354]|uniref:PucR family transcriptional regulator n=1 Tax=unclassified Streptomyces TaxID=2593676 RepID=UPI0029B250DC|nr:helix-turn-helix domain-containing protein [Streptomyces sp. MI02-7b]MDX3072510.1 helix-turn-helix domain-containing protein [Streptomyces sp. MI02-7b]